MLQKINANKSKKKKENFFGHLMLLTMALAMLLWQRNFKPYSQGFQFSTWGIEFLDSSEIPLKRYLSRGGK